MTVLQSFTTAGPANGFGRSKAKQGNCGPAADFPAAAGQRPGGRREAGLRATLRASVLASLLTALRAWRRAVGDAVLDPDEAGDATLRDLCLENRSGPSPYDLADLHPGLESTRMRLFVMTGHFWRGS